MRQRFSRPPLSLALVAPRRQAVGGITYERLAGVVLELASPVAAIADTAVSIVFAEKADEVRFPPRFIVGERHADGRAQRSDQLLVEGFGSISRSKR